MHAQLLQATTLVAALYAAGPLVSPATIPTEQLPYHVGQSVEVRGHVVDVEPTPGAWRVTVHDPEGALLVLDRDPPPPLGAKIRVVGDATMDRDGPVLWATTWTVQERPNRDPIGVDALLEQAPRLEGSPVAVVGTWSDEDRALEDDGALPVQMRAARPGDGARIVAWGLLAYVPEDAAYRLQAVGWEEWTPLRA